MDDSNKEKLGSYKGGTMERTVCHDCGVKEGQIHQRGCDMERCGFCGGQLITCSCCYIKLGFDYKEPIWDHATKSFTCVINY